MYRTALTLCLLVSLRPAAAAAALVYQGAQRFVQSDGFTREPRDIFGPMDLATPGARQQSEFQPQSVSVFSSVIGGPGQGLSVMKINFHLDEPAPWSAFGSFSLLGESGFACVSLVNLARHDTLLLNEIAGDPPAANLHRTWTAGGFLEPGDYLLDAIIYTGSDGSAHTGSLQMQFSIPEPSAAWLTVVAAALMNRRRQGAARTRENSRAPLPAA